MDQPPATFPPILAVGSRVWTCKGFQDHGLEGSKVNIAPNQGGTVEGVEKPYITYDQLLYAIRWDDGTTSKHYSGKLVAIDRFRTLEELECAIQVEGTVQRTDGPQGGFRSARLCLVYSGHRQTVEITDIFLWKEVLEPLFQRGGVTVTRNRLPRQPR